MKKILVIFPSIVLIMVFIIGVFLQEEGRKNAVNYLVIGVAGTFIYAPVTILSSGIFSTFSMDGIKWKQRSLKFKSYYYYWAIIWALDIIVAMYFMTHN